MPVFKDWDNLPYLSATVREVLRWRTIGPMGGPHYTKQDDWYQGYFIPKDTVCFSNAWTINRDKTLYGEDADDFNPDRFIDQNGRLSAPLAETRNEGHISFGFGPRICVGRHLANNALFINIASILWSCKISPAIDHVGKPMIPDTFATGEPAINVGPLPFHCSIRARFPEAAAIITQTRELL